MSVASGKHEAWSFDVTDFSYGLDLHYEMIEKHR